MNKSLTKAFGGVSIGLMFINFRNPLFYFGVFSVILFLGLYFACNSSAFDSANTQGVLTNSFFKSGQQEDRLFFEQQSSRAMETPDLKLAEGNTLSAVATPQVLTPKTM